MQPENLDFDSIMEARRKAVEQSIHPLTHQELVAIGETLFAKNPSHQWKEAFDRFIAENPHGSFYHAETDDKLQLVYCAEQEKGIWFLPGVGMGILRERGIAALKAILARG